MSDDVTKSFTHDRPVPKTNSPKMRINYRKLEPLPVDKKRIEVLDHGFVELVDMMGDDYSILRAARVSTGSNAVKGPEKDKNLIRYLYRNNHISPFSFVSFHFHVKCPIFVARQWFRHRTFDFNEASARYKEFEWETWSPESWRKQDPQNKQGSIDELDFSDTIKEVNDSVQSTYQKIKETYEDLLEIGVAREQARLVMPVGQYTEFFAHISLRNLFHFLDLRLHPHAQEEIRVYAEAILELLSAEEGIQWSMEAFQDFLGLQRAYEEALNKAVRTYKDLDKFKQYLDSF